METSKFKYLCSVVNKSFKIFPVFRMTIFSVLGSGQIEDATGVRTSPIPL